jgi:hypothetical protein
MITDESGKIWFEIGAKTDRFKEDAAKISSSFNDIVRDLAADSTKIDDIFKNLGKGGVSQLGQQIENALNTQKAKIEEVWTEASKLEYILKQVATTTPSLLPEYEPLKKTLAEAYEELDRQEDKLQVLEQAYKAFAKAQDDSANAMKGGSSANITYQREMMLIKEEMAQIIDLSRANGTNYAENERYKELQKELEKVATTYRIVQNEQKQLSKGGAQIQGIVQGLQALSGVFTAGMGIASLFIDDNERLAKVQKNLQAAIAMTVGIQQVANAVNEQSAFRLQFLNKITVAYKASLAQQATATGITSAANLGLAATFKAVGAAIKAVPGIGWIVAGIGLLLAIMPRLTKASREAKKANDEFAKSVADMSAKSMASVNKLAAEWKKLDNLADKTKFIKDNKKAFDELGVSINNVAQAEQLLVHQTQDFIKALLLKAKAAAAMDIVEKTYKEGLSDKKKQEAYTRYINALTALEQKKKAKETYFTNNPDTKDTSFEISIKLQENLVNAYKKRWDELNAETEQKAQMFLKINLDATKEYDVIMGSFGKLPEVTMGVDYYINSIKQAQKEIETMKGKGNMGLAIETKEGDISGWKDKLKELTGKSYEEFEAEKKIITDAQNKIRELILAGREKQAQDEINAMDDGLQKRLAQIDFDKEMELKVLAKKNKELEEEYKKAKAPVPSEVKIEYEDSKKKVEDKADKAGIVATEQYYKDLAALQQQATDFMLSEEERRKKGIEDKWKDLYDAIKKLAGKDIADAFLPTIDAAKQKDMYSDLLERYKTYQEQLTAIAYKYAKEREEIEAALAKKAITSQEAEVKIEENKKAEAKETTKFNEDFAKEAIEGMAAFETIFNNVANISRETRDKVIADLETLLSQLELFKKGAQIDNPIVSNEAFEALSKAPKEVQGLIEKLNILKEQSISTTHPFVGLAKSIKRIKELQKEIAEGGGDDKMKKAAEELAKIWKGMPKWIGTALGEMGKITSGAFSLAGALGADKDNLSEVEEWMNIAMDSVAGIMEGFTNGGPIGAIVAAASAALKILTKIIKDNIDNAQNAIIERNQKKIDELQKSYANLEKSIEGAFSTTKAKYLNEMTANLEKQKKLIEEQLAAEESKKNKDQDAIQKYKSELEDIEKNLKDFQEQAFNAIFGQDIKSAIEDFAQAYVDAWAAGEDKAEAMKDVVRKMIKTVIKGLLSDELQDAVKRVTTLIQDAVMGGYEIDWDRINEIIDDATAVAERKFAGYDKFMEDERMRSASVGGFAAANQDSVNELNARFALMNQLQAEGISYMGIISRNSSEILSEVTKIKGDTARLEKMEKDMNSVRQEITEINTRGIKIRE